MTALVPLRAQATPATSSTSLWTLCQVLLGHKLRSPRCHKVQPDAAYRARRTRGQRHRASAPAHFVHSRWPRRWRKACVAEGMDGPGWLRHIAILRSCMAPVAVRKTRHVRAASNCIADRVYMCRCVCLRVLACVCVLARAQAPQNLTKKSPLPALICRGSREARLFEAPRSRLCCLVFGPEHRRREGSRRHRQLHGS